MAQLGRLLTAMVTPMRPDGALDLPQAERLATALLESGSEGLVVAGTTGESPTLEFEEERQLFSALLPIVRAHNGSLVAGTGSNSTRTAVEASRKAAALGMDALLLVVPYYNKPSQDGLYAHFRAVAESVDVPCMLYNVPGRTGVNLAAETVLRLAHDLPNLCGVKEAGGDLEQVAAIIEGAPDGFRVWSGNDADNLPILALGGYGAVSVLAHLTGRQLQSMIAAHLAGQHEQAAALARRLLPLTKALFLVGNPAPLKFALNELGFHVGAPRLPLVEPPEAVKAQIRAALASTPIDLPLPA